MTKRRSWGQGLIARAAADAALSATLRAQYESWHRNLSEVEKRAHADEARRMRERCLALGRAKLLFDAYDSDLPEDEFGKHFGEWQPSVLDVVMIDVFRSEMARSRRAARTRKSDQARAHVLKEWAVNGGEYGSKADFARIQARIVANKFGVKVTARTIERDWLPSGSVRDAVNT